MRFGRRKRGGGNIRRDKKQQIRQQIWEDPSVVEQLFGDKDWQAYEAKHEPVAVPSREMVKNIEERIKRIEQERERTDRRDIRIRRLTAYAVAASLLLLLSFSLWHWRNAPVESASFHKLQVNNTPISDTTWVKIRNTKDTEMEIQLPDNSKVKLFASSSIRYPEQFSQDKREIQLEGKAYFTVAADKQRPFSVYAKGTKTTALGTSFTIDTRRQADKISVQLHTGKIVIASTAAIPDFKSVYLSHRGETLIFDPNKLIIEHQRPQPVREAKTPVTPAPASDDALLKFDNVPLSAGFQALGKAYQTRITIADPAITHILCRASLDTDTQTFRDVLTVVCLTNDLQFIAEQDGSFTIDKQENTQQEL